jgi:hypothetical protein
MKKKCWHLAFLAVLTVTFLFSCQEGDPGPSGEQSDIYVCGYTGVAPNINAVYWKNGVITELKNPTNAYSFANDILVIGNDVYVVGGLFNASFLPTAVYWKNGVMTKLSNNSSSARAIASNGTDIFIAGNDSGGGYWQNGNFIQFANSSLAQDIFVSGTDIHAVGLLESGGSISPLYWKNNVITNLPGSSGPTKITVGSSGVYICGNISNEYWSNGNQINVPNAQSISSVTTFNSDVYFSGVSNGYPFYWKNGVASKMDNTGYPGAIQVVGADVYVIGNMGSSSNSSALYWKNGVRTKLSASLVSRANGLFVN